LSKYVFKLSVAAHESSWSQRNRQKNKQKNLTTVLKTENITVITTVDSKLTIKQKVNT